MFQDGHCGWRYVTLVFKTGFYISRCRGMAVGFKDKGDDKAMKKYRSRTVDIWRENPSSYKGDPDSFEKW